MACFQAIPEINLGTLWVELDLLSPSTALNGRNCQMEVTLASCGACQTEDGRSTPI
jgi:hypothetical protein